MKRFKRKSKSIKEALSYEQIPENKKRRKVIPKGDYGQAIARNTRVRRVRAVLVNKLRQSREVYSVVVEKINERMIMVAILVYTLGFFISGFLAAEGLRFESLLTAVVAVLAAAFIGGKE